eukprot:403350727
MTNHNHQIQNQYFNYINSFYNEHDLEGNNTNNRNQQSSSSVYLQTQQLQPSSMLQINGISNSSSRRGGQQQSNSIQNGKSQTIQSMNYNSMSSKDYSTKPISYNTKMQTQPIVSLKKSSSGALNDKYQVYLAGSDNHSRQAMTSLGYQTQQILPLSSYSTASIHQHNLINMGITNTTTGGGQHTKTEQFKISGHKQKGNSPGSSNKKAIKSLKSGNHKQRKSVSKENLSNQSSRGASQFINEAQKSSQNIYSQGNQSLNKHKSRIVKSSIKNQNSNLSDQIAAVYNSDINAKSPQNLQYAIDQISQRQGFFEDKLKQRVQKIQQNYQSQPNNSKTQRISGKSMMRNNSQLKLKSQNQNNAHSQLQNIDSFEGLNGQLLSGHALTTKNQTSNSHLHMFNMSQTNLRNHQKESFQFSQNNIEQRKFDQTNDYHNSDTTTNTISMTRPSQSNKMQQKIQKIIQATQSTTIHSNMSMQSQMQNSYSQGNLRKSMQPNKNTSNISNNSIPKIFRPQSLKQLMPTIDEQIMKLTEISNNAGSPQKFFQDPTQQYHQNSNYLFKTLADQAKLIQQTSKRSSKIQANPPQIYSYQDQQQSIPLQTHQPPSQFKGQIIKSINNQNHHNRNLPLQFNHKESIEGGKLSKEERNKLKFQNLSSNSPIPQNNSLKLSTHQTPIKAQQNFDQKGAEDNSNIKKSLVISIDDNLQQQLQNILMRTQLTLKASKKREDELTIRVEEQESQIQLLKEKILQYEKLIPQEQIINN